VRRPCHLIPALALFPLAPAAELVLRDLEATVAVLPTAFSFRSSAAGYSASGSDAFQSGTGLGLGGRYALVPAGSSLGLLAGLDLTGQWSTYQGGSGFTAYGLRAAAGAAWAPADRLVLGTEAGLATAFARFDLPASEAGPGYAATGTALGYDLRLSARWALSERWRVQFLVGYLVSSSSLAGGGVDLTIDQRGLYLGLGASWQLSTRPTRLE
jgi:hypothetical protein